MPRPPIDPPKLLGRDGLDQARALLEQQWPDVDWALRFRRQWTENPACPSGDPRAWGHEVDGRLVSFFGGIPLRYRIRGQDVLASGATSLVVHPDQRRQGLSRQLVEAWLAQSDVALWVNATSNAESRGVFESLEFSERTRGERLERLMVVDTLRYAAIAAGRRVEGSSWLKAFQPALEWVGALLLLSQRHPPRTTGHYVWEPEPVDSREFDRLWMAERDKQDATLVRDASLSQWLYFERPRGQNNRLMLGRTPDGRVRASAGFWVDEDKSQMRQVDLFGDVSHPDCIPQLMRSAFDLAKNAGCAALRMRLPKELVPDASRDAWAPCQGQFYYRSACAQLQPSFSDLDGDGCLDLIC